MKRYLPFFVFLTILLTPLYPVYAEEVRPSIATENNIAPVFRKPATSATQSARVAPKIRLLTHEEIASKEALLKQRLLSFKDKVKADRADRVSTILNMINQNRTTEMTNNLNLMSSMLTKLDSILSENAQKGKDVASAEASIATAKTSIQTALDDVNSQKGSDYTLVVTSEQTVKTDAMTDRNKLYMALVNLRQEILTAKSDTIKALQATYLVVKGSVPNGQ